MGLEYQIKGTIYMPHPTPKQKVAKVKQFGGEWVEIILIGDTFDDAYHHALAESIKDQKAFIHPFNDIDVINGQGTIAKEILQQTDQPLDYLFVAVGGGGLYNEDAIVVEPAGAVSIAALEDYKSEIKGKRVGIIICGGNNDVNRTQEIKERALLHEGKKHYFIVRGGLFAFPNLYHKINIGIPNARFNGLAL
ncbi:unnamed protein product [Cyprideis torosa]|uniref:L-serine deaminase n=1 Tax=Cyprideis torosa TaxID=163714 RepID=A0A7R8ZQV8_9CRUS|nr:unnamed protein product [Cyprideis torosa]CAG0903838.1 unnamed protein product [Cyprideis torosa]